MLPSRVWRLFLIGFFFVVGFLLGTSLVWNIVGHTCRTGGELDFTFWPKSVCQPIDRR